MYFGLYEYQDMAFLLDTLRAGETMVDVGANVGTFTVLGAVCCRAHVECFEPDPTARERLLRNIRLNSIDDKVRIHHVGLSDRSGTAQFTSNLDAMNHLVIDEVQHQHTDEIQLRTLDEVMAQEVHILKIDVEGWETAVLRGATGVLSQPSLYACIVEINESMKRYGFSEADILTTMESNGFREVGYDPRLRMLINTPDRRLNNALFVRDSELVAERLSEAPNRVVLGKNFVRN